ncbi:MAG: RsmD family RNA methyltransferase [Ruthenibacterium lactatiformans]
MRIIAGEARYSGTALHNAAALHGEEITRPTVARVKEGMFSAVQFLLAGARVLDAVCGLGPAWHRGA